MPTATAGPHCCDEALRSPDYPRLCFSVEAEAGLEEREEAEEAEGLVRPSSSQPASGVLRDVNERRLNETQAMLQSPPVGHALRRSHWLQSPAGA